MICNGWEKSGKKKLTKLLHLPLNWYLQNSILLETLTDQSELEDLSSNEEKKVKEEEEKENNSSGRSLKIKDEDYVAKFNYPYYKHPKPLYSNLRWWDHWLLEYQDEDLISFLRSGDSVEDGFEEHSTQ